MTNRTWAIACVICVVAGAGVGRYSLPAKVVTKVQTVTVDSSKSNTKVDDHSVVTVTKKPDGSTITVTQNNITTDVKAQVTDVATSDSEKTVTYNTQRWNIAVIAATDFKSAGPIYGAEASYRILGPFRIGAMVLANGTAGASLGISF